LELIKRRVVQVEQAEPFGDILIRKNEGAPELSEAQWAELTGLTDVS
jgi:chromatin segregation and condensation protein Rec8/ScpA/Scc1 (kleisin family)